MLGLEGEGRSKDITFKYYIGLYYAAARNAIYFQTVISTIIDVSLAQSACPQLGHFRFLLNRSTSIFGHIDAIASVCSSPIGVKIQTRMVDALIASVRFPYRHTSFVNRV